MRWNPRSCRWAARRHRPSHHRRNQPGLRCCRRGSCHRHLQRHLRRHLRPYHAVQVLELGIPGVATLREYRRYYPAGEVAGHLLGFTNIDDIGQSPDGSLWFAAWGGQQLFTYHETDLIEYSELDGLSSSPIGGVCTFSDGTVWYIQNQDLHTFLYIFKG